MHLSLKKKKGGGSTEVDADQIVSDTSLDDIRSVITFEDETEQTKEPESEMSSTDVMVEQQDQVATAVQSEKTTVEQQDKKTLGLSAKASQADVDTDGNNEGLREYSRTIRQNASDIKQIKDNVTSIEKDLDEVISLYELVSEQMNPFVGLSKITRKRLESIENYTRDIEAITAKIDELEVYTYSNKTRNQPSSFQTGSSRSREDGQGHLSENEFSKIFIETLEVINHRKNKKQALEEITQLKNTNNRREM